MEAVKRLKGLAENIDQAIFPNGASLRFIKKRFRTGEKGFGQQAPFDKSEINALSADGKV